MKEFQVSSSAGQVWKYSGSLFLVEAWRGSLTGDWLREGTGCQHVHTEESVDHTDKHTVTNSWIILFLRLNSEVVGCCDHVSIKISTQP